jgi:hypothetical protein
MEEPASKNILDSTKAAAEASAGGQQTRNAAGGQPAGGPPAQTPAGPDAEGALLRVESVKFMPDILEKAELLLGYAAESGIEIEDKVRDGIIEARVASDRGSISEQAVNNLLTASTTLAGKVRPVTAESLKVWGHPEEARKTIRFYGRIAIGIGCIIVLISLVAFVSNAVSQRIKTDIATANDLASKLRAELGPPPPASMPNTSNRAGTGNAAKLSQDEVWFGPGGVPSGLAAKDVISDLQQFAATMREIDGYARQLNYFLFSFKPVSYLESQTNRAPGRKALELTPGLDVLLSQELTDKVEEYQQVRNFGNNVQERATVYDGAIATTILPVLYALLGAGAFLLRSYEDQIKSRTLVAGDRHIARFLIAGIGGLVVGLFNVTQGITISPFAVAFLVGYAVDVFFAFLEGLLQMFRRSPAQSGAPGTPPKPSS